MISPLLSLLLEGSKSWSICYSTDKSSWNAQLLCCPTTPTTSPLWKSFLFSCEGGEGGRLDEKVYYSIYLFIYNYVTTCWDQFLIYWDDLLTNFVSLTEVSGAGHCQPVLLLWGRLSPTILEENLPNLAHMFWQDIWSKLEQAFAGFPCSALNSSCGKPLTMLHLVSNLDVFYISIYYVWMLKIATRSEFVPIPSVHLQCSQPTERQYLI